MLGVDTERLLDKSKSLRDGAITHPDYRVGGWLWREQAASTIARPMRQSNRGRGKTWGIVNPRKAGWGIFDQPPRSLNGGSLHRRATLAR